MKTGPISNLVAAVENLMFIKDLTNKIAVDPSYVSNVLINTQAQAALVSIKSNAYELVCIYGNTQMIEDMVRYAEHLLDVISNTDTEAVKIVQEEQQEAISEVTATITSVLTEEERVDQLNRAAMEKQPGGRRMVLYPYKRLPSKLNFNSFQIIRTPYHNHNGVVIAPMYFYVDQTLHDAQGKEILSGWRLGENKMAAQKYAVKREIYPDQYTVITDTHVTFKEIGLDKVISDFGGGKR